MTYKFKILIFALMLLALSACKKDDEPTKTTFIHITAKYDSGSKGPEGNVLLFDLTDNKVRDFSLISAGGIYAIYDVNNEYIFPAYNKKLVLSTDLKTGIYINESLHSIFSSSLSRPLPREFLVVIDLDSEPYSYTYVKVSWVNNNIELNKVFKSKSSETGKHFESWN